MWRLTIIGLYSALWLVMVSSQAYEDKFPPCNHLSTPPRIILVDVDNTLYDESVVGLERQIVRSIHKYCNRLGVTEEEADTLHQEFGSTIKGLTETFTKPLCSNDFYREVYDAIDVSSLIGNGAPNPGSTPSTGYTYERGERETLRKILSSCNAQLYVASNSPSSHVRKVLQLLGLARVPWRGLLSPDTRETTSGLLPTKDDPVTFFGPLLHEEAVILLDDSPRVLATTSSFFTGVRVSRDNPIVPALCRSLEWVEKNYNFDDVEYLKTKNEKDFESMSREVWQEFKAHLAHSVNQHNLNDLCFVDLGAGRLSLLRLLLFGHQDLLALDVPNVSTIQYYAYESNRRLEAECVEQLERLGFRLLSRYKWRHESSEDPEFVFIKTAYSVTWTVHLRLWKFDEHESRCQPPPNAVLGCCFADLLPPLTLAASLVRFVAKRSVFDDTYFYFPITFRGTTQFLPPQPLEMQLDNAIPSDTTAFALYSRSLERTYGHNLDPTALSDALSNYGAQCLAIRSSDWVVGPYRDSYLWETLFYFFGTVAGPELQAKGWDARLWLERARRTKPEIHVSNVDLLFRLPRIGHWKPSLSPETQLKSDLFYREIRFEAPHVTSVVTKPVPELQPRQVRVKSEVSLISSGTELKIFQGCFDDAPLDVSFSGMRNKRMSYPISYGYSLVGRVVECGSLAQGDLLGKLVFCFSPHATQAVVDQNDLQVVPEGITSLDAIFLASVETALSLVHDAHPRFGDNVVVFGQGLIGLLTTGILQRTILPWSSGILTTVDAIPSRLAASARFGSTQALFPAELQTRSHFDIAIEISGNARALQQAIDVTRNGGKVVVGSWYGNNVVPLLLGMEFHRSRKSIKASQVSDIPAELTSRWTKTRRFNLSWDIVRALRPSRLITRLMSLDQAQDAFLLLEEGTEVVIAFDYSM
jgi:threonine dehydrogenase-like Zn-dependent dehydrogenase